MIKNILALCIFSCLIFASCKSRTDVAAVEGKIETTTAKTGNKYTLVAFKPSTEYADATINSYTYKE